MKRDVSRVSGFFFEIILVICFFAVSAVVTLQLFAVAGSRARQSSDLSVAVIRAQDLAEKIQSFSSWEEFPQALKGARHTRSGKTEHFQMDYDEQWNQTQSSPCYRIDMALTQSAAESGTMVDADISVFRCKQGVENQIFTLSTAKYLPNPTQ